MTTIHVKEETWQKLNQLKQPGETMDDVVRRLLKRYEITLANEQSGRIDIDELVEEFIRETEDIDHTIEAMRKGWKRSK